MSEFLQSLPQRKGNPGGGFSYPVFGFFLRVALLAVIWWVISDGAGGSWLIGLPVLLIAAHLSLVLRAPQPQRIRWVSLIKFTPYFVYESLRGGIDVARRVFSPRPSITPGFLTYPVRLPDEGAQTFFANIISLLPGTLGAGIKDDLIQLHVLDENAQIIRELEVLESKIAPIFGIDWDSCKHPQQGAQK